MQLNQYNIKSLNQGQWYDTVLVNNDYYANGKPRYAHAVSDERFNRAYAFDHADRLRDAYSGADASSFVGQTSSAVAPYQQSYQYDAFDGLRARTSRFWSQTDAFSTTYLNGRNQDPTWQYNENGDVKRDKDLEYKYDTMGVNYSVRPLNDSNAFTQTVDADRNMVKRSRYGSSKYYLRSKLLSDKVLIEYDSIGNWQSKYFYLEGELLATETPGNFLLEHQHPLTGSRGRSFLSGTSGIYFPTEEPDSLGVDVGFADPNDVPPQPPQEPDMASLVAGMPTGRCILEGIAVDCIFAWRLLAGGTAVRCPNDDCNARPIQAWDENGNLHTLGFATLLSSGVFISDGESGEFLFFDDIRYGTPLEAFMMSFENPELQRKKKKGRKRARTVTLPQPNPSPQSSPSPPTCTGPIPADAARRILAAADAEGIDPTLLSVTWRHESWFDLRPKPNPRKEQGKIVGYDVGPIQISTNFYHKSPFIDGLPLAYYGERYSFSPFTGGGILNQFSKNDVFTGDPDQNLRLAGRAYALDILPRSEGKDKLHRLADAAGIYRGKFGYQDRYNQYLAEAPADEVYLNCLRRSQ